MSSEAAPDRGPVVVDLPGVPPDLETEVRARVEEFEREHEADVMGGGPGWVPHMSPRDYLLAGVVNAVFIVWLAVAFVTG